MQEPKQLELRRRRLVEHYEAVPPSEAQDSDFIVIYTEYTMFIQGPKRSSKVRKILIML